MTIVYLRGLQACFDEIDHTALMGRVRGRIADKRVLDLVKALRVAARRVGVAVRRAGHRHRRARLRNDGVAHPGNPGERLPGQRPFPAVGQPDGVVAVLVFADDGQPLVVEADLNPLTAPTLADVEVTPARWSAVPPLYAPQGHAALVIDCARDRHGPGRVDRVDRRRR